MVLITADTWRKNGVEVIIFGDIKWLNETHIKKTVKTFKFKRGDIKISTIFKKTKTRIAGLFKTTMQKIFKRRFCSSNNNGLQSNTCSKF